jgi:hypothetical protein
MNLLKGFKTRSTVMLTLVFLISISINNYHLHNQFQFRRANTSFQLEICFDDFFERHFLERQSDNSIYVFLTNNSVNEHQRAYLHKQECFYSDDSIYRRYILLKVDKDDKCLTDFLPVVTHHNLDESQNCLPEVIRDNIKKHKHTSLYGIPIENKDEIWGTYNKFSFV